MCIIGELTNAMLMALLIRVMCGLSNLVVLLSRALKAMENMQLVVVAALFIMLHRLKIIQMLKHQYLEHSVMV